jgi:hypothetical protein
MYVVRPHKSLYFTEICAAENMRPGSGGSWVCRGWLHVGPDELAGRVFFLQPRGSIIFECPYESVPFGF